MRISRGPTNRKKRVREGPVPNLHFNGQDEAASHFAGAKGLKMLRDPRQWQAAGITIPDDGRQQVLNRALPAVAGIKPNLTIKVAHRDANVRTDF